MALPIVAIVGRPNVGKSSLFNRIIRSKLAVIHDTSGVTRDRNFAIADWNGREFYLVDTGGMVPGTSDQMELLIFEQSQLALDQADVILLMVDCQTGITDLDQRIARDLRKTAKPVILVVNKTDNERLQLEAAEFYSLGFDPVQMVSAANGLGTGDLLDIVVESLPTTRDEEHDEDIIRVAVVGRPNVGKSSFVNKLLGRQRHIVSDVPGTTRDAIDSPFELNGKKYILVDTAGLRKRSRVKESVEFYTTLRTSRAIERCDIAVVLMEASEGLNFQELKIIDEVAEAKRGMVLVINKWDIFEKDEYSADIYMRQIREAVPTHSYIPIVFTSALTGQRVIKTMQYVDAVYDQFTRRIATSELNEFLEEAVAKQPPAAVRGRWIKLYYMTQPETAPPIFVIFSNFPQFISDSYHRYLQNRMRERFGFEGVPITLKLKARKDKK